MKLRALSMSFVVFGMFASLLLATADITPVSAACTSNFFGLPAWYDGLVDGSCNIVEPDKVGGLTAFTWKIVLNIIEAFLVVVGYASVIMIIAGGYKYMIATGSPDKIKGAKDTIRNAVIGLVIALGSVAIVNAIAGAL